MNAPYRPPFRAPRSVRLRLILLALCMLALLLAVASPRVTFAETNDNLVVSTYPRYRLVDLGTLGGPNGARLFPAVSLNNQGNVIAFSSTATLDPYPFTIQDEFIWHGIVSDSTGAVRDLGALPGTNQSLAGAISQNGLIAGFSGNGVLDPLTDFPQLRAAFWGQDRQIVDLGTLGGNASAATAVNGRGQVAGVALNAQPEDPDVAAFFLGGGVPFPPAAQQARAFLWENGSMRDLGTLGGNNAFSAAINESGQVTGFSSTGRDIHPFIWQNGEMRDLGSLGGSLALPGSLVFGSFGRVMNERGEIAGTSLLPGDETWHAFLWSNGTMTDLGTLEGGSNTDALAINDAGQVVGRARTGVANVRHAFLWEKGRMTDLGNVAPCKRASATSINNKGQIVGQLEFCGDPFESAFYVEKGGPMVDLNTLITPPSPIHLDGASFINDRGEIAAGGLMPDGTTRAVLLVPLPGSSK